jgi:hypothetical protein
VSWPLAGRQAAEALGLFLRKLNLRRSVPQAQKKQGHAEDNDDERPDPEG